MESTKERAREHFIDVISHSWTWARLSREEQSRFWDVLPQETKGTFLQRYEVFNAVYAAYLQGLGYKPLGWREVKYE